MYRSIAIVRAFMHYVTVTSRAEIRGHAKSVLRCRVLLADRRVRATIVTPITVLRDARYGSSALLVCADRSLLYFPRDFAACHSTNQSQHYRLHPSSTFRRHFGERENSRQTREPCLGVTRDASWKCGLYDIRQFPRALQQ